MRSRRGPHIEPARNLLARADKLLRAHGFCGRRVSAGPGLTLRRPAPRCASGGGRRGAPWPPETPSGRIRAGRRSSASVPPRTSTALASRPLVPMSEPGGSRSCAFATAPGRRVEGSVRAGPEPPHRGPAAASRRSDVPVRRSAPVVAADQVRHGRSGRQSRRRSPGWGRTLQRETASARRESMADLFAAHCAA